MKKGFSSLVAILFSIALTIIVAGTFFYWYSGIQASNQDLVFNSFSQTQRGIITETELLIDSLYSTEGEADPNGLADFRHTICNTGETKIDLGARRSILIKETDSEDFICKVDDFTNQCLNSTRHLVGGLAFDNVEGDITVPSFLVSDNGTTWSEIGSFSEVDNVLDFVEHAIQSGGASPTNIFAVVNSSANGDQAGFLGWSEDASNWKFEGLEVSGSNVSGFSLASDPISNTLFIGANRATGLIGAQILKAVVTTINGIAVISTTNVTSLPADGSTDYDGAYALFTNGSVFLAGTANVSGTVGTGTGVIYRSTSPTWSSLTTPTLPHRYLRINDFEQVNNRIYAATTGIPSDGSSRSDVIYSDDGGSTWTSTTASLSAFLSGYVALLDDPDDTGLEVYSLRGVASTPDASLRRYDGSSWSTVFTWTDASPHDITVDNRTGYFYAALRNESLSANGSEIWRSGPNFNDANWTRVYSNTLRGAASAVDTFDECTIRRPACVSGCEGVLQPGECSDVRIALEDSTCDLIPDDHECVLMYSSLAHGTITKEDWFEFCRLQNPGDQVLIDHDGGFGTGILTPVVLAANRLPLVTTATLTSADPTRNSTDDNLIVSSSAFDPDGDPTTRVFDWRVNHSTVFFDSNMSIAALNMPFDEFTNSSTLTIRDYSSYKNHGLKSGSPVEKNSTECGLVPGGNIGGCIFFDTADLITVNHSDIGNPQGSYTLTAWIKPDSTKASGTGTIIDKTFGLSGYALSYNFATNQVIGTWYDSGSGINTVTSTDDTPADEWSFVVLRRDEDTTEIELFINQSCSGGSCTDSFFTAGYGPGDLTIGSSFQGHIENVLIFNRSLSDEEIDLMYSASGTPVLQFLSSGETKVYDTWQVQVTAVDTETGGNKLTNNLTIQPIPNSSIPLLFSSAHPYFNTTLQNYTAINQSFTDISGNPLVAIYDWRTNGSASRSIAPLNLHFETESDNSAKDYSTFSNTASITDATWSSATSCGIPASNACYLFDGAGDRITVTDSTAFDLVNMTVMLWLNPSTAYSSSLTDDVWLIGKDSGAFADGDWRLAIDDDGRLNFTVSSASTTTSIRSTQSSWTGGSSYPVAAGYDVTNGELFMYIGGATGTKTEESTVSLASADFTSNSQTLYIGSHPSIVDDFFGYLDGVQVYNRSVSFEQFSAMSTYSGIDGYTAIYNLTVSQEVRESTNLSVAVTPNNAIVDGKERVASILVDTESAPSSATPVLESTDMTTNDTQQNLTAFNQSFDDPDADALTGIYDWMVNTTVGAPGSPESIAVLNLPFDSINNQTIKDYSSFERNATITGDVTWTRGPNCVSGGCYDFAAGNNDYITAPIPANYIGENFTVTVWASGTGAVDYVLDSSEFGRGFELYYTTTGTDGYVISLKNGSVSETLELKAPTSLTTHQFIAFSNNNRTNEVKLYVNGTLITSAVWPLNPFYPSLTDLRIGGLIPCSGNCWDGQIDEVKIFNRTLSDEQIAAMYNESSHSPVNNFIHQFETLTTENWTVAITPNDGQLDGATRNASILITGNEPVTHSTPLLNASTVTNSTFENLTAYNMSFRDHEGDPMIAIYDWRVNMTPGGPINTSIAVLNMPFDTNVSSTTTNAVKDYSTFKNNGTRGAGVEDDSPTWRNSATCGLAEGGGCYEFDGTDDFIEVSDDASITPTTSNWSVVAWFNPDSSGSGDDVFVSKSDGSNGWYLEYRHAISRVRAFVCSGVCSSSITESGTSADDAWHMAVLTYDESSNDATLFVDGAEEGSSSPVYSAGSGIDVNFGQRSDTLQQFQGEVSNVQIYNRTLTPGQVAAMYNGGEPRFNVLYEMDTTAGENYTVLVTPSDGFNDGYARSTNSLYVEHILEFNNSHLEATYYPPADIIEVYDWRTDIFGENVSIAVLNMAFDKRYTDTTSERVQDYSSFKANGTLGGGTAANVPTWTGASDCGLSDEAGGCYNFDGTNDYISIADADFTQPVNFTVSVWFKRDVTSPCTGASTTCGIVSKIDTAATDGWEIYWDETTGRPQYQRCLSGGCSGGTFGCAAPAVGTWQHLAMYISYDPTLGRVYHGIYCDAHLYAHGFSAGTAEFTSTQDIEIGHTSDSGSTVDYFDGHIDDVIIFNRSVEFSSNPDLNFTINIPTLKNDGDLRHNRINSSDLTTPGETWQVQVYHNDSSRTILSNPQTLP